MPIKFYNTLTREKEKFIPLQEGKVKLYTCGPTVYDTAHIGNFRTFLFEDLLKRFLLLKGFQVTHVMNITDVDDKTILRCNSNDVSIENLTEKYIKLFMQDLQILKILPADNYPKATEHVGEMIEMVERLIAKKYAYQSDDNSIYFNINKFERYGQLANLNFDEQIKSLRIATDDYSKDNPQDFVLWKAWKPEDGKVFWNSPWGKGRPGWHIECSAMSNKYLGDHFDIHCGGVDNIFPHHENEIAQSECANDHRFVNYWMHSEHLLIDNGKMSKSAGNFYKISELIEMGFTPEALRYLLLSGHYRTNINFSIEHKHEALKAVQRICDFNDRIIELNEQLENAGDLPDDYNDFIFALANDLNTPEALAVFFEWIRKTNSKIDNNTITKDEIVSAVNFIEKFNLIFDLLPNKIEVPAEILELAEERQIARQNKEWFKADSIRKKLTELGWVIEDKEKRFSIKRLL